MLIVYDYLDAILASRQPVPEARPVQLRYYASDLLESLGAENDPFARSEAVRRTMKICHAAGISIDQNFRRVYVYSGPELEPDWLMSSVAAFLLLLNGDPESPLVAKAQLMMLLKMKDPAPRAGR